MPNCPGGLSGVAESQHTRLGTMGDQHGTRASSSASSLSSRACHEGRSRHQARQATTAALRVSMARIAPVLTRNRARYRNSSATGIRARVNPAARMSHEAASHRGAGWLSARRGSSRLSNAQPGSRKTSGAASVAANVPQVITQPLASWPLPAGRCLPWQTAHQSWSPYDLRLYRLHCPLLLPLDRLYHSRAARANAWPSYSGAILRTAKGLSEKPRVV